jgi:hypothetical protein
MNPMPTGKRIWSLSKCLKVSGLGLVFCLAALSAHAQQNQMNQMPPATQQPDSQQQEQPDAQTQGQPSQVVPPQTLTLPAGTVVRVRVDEWLSSDRNVAGDSFGAVLDQPIVVDGWVVARRGQAQTGRVTTAKKAGHSGGTSQLGVDMPELTLVDGQQLPIQTDLFQTSAGTSRGRDIAAVGTTTGVGAAIGAIAEGGVGAAVGAGIGATAGIIGVMVTRGRPTEVPPETVLTFRLQSPVTVSTDRGQLAFQPVTQADYDSQSSQNRPNLRRRGPPPYYPYPYPYGYPYPYAYYPGPFAFGIYGGYGRYGRYWR